MWIVIGAFFLVPIFAAQAGIDVNLFNQVITRPAAAIISSILRLTGNRLAPAATQHYS